MKVGQEFIVCPYCERTRRVNVNGKVRKHQSTSSSAVCTGSGTPGANHIKSPIRLGNLPASIIPGTTNPSRT